MLPSSSQKPTFVKTTLTQLKDENKCPITGKSTPCTSEEDGLVIAKSFPAMLQVGNSFQSGDIIYTCGKTSNGTCLHSHYFTYKLPENQPQAEPLSEEQEKALQDDIKQRLKNFLSGRRASSGDM